MHEISKRIAELITRHLCDKLDDEGARELDRWRSEAVENEELFVKLTSNKLIERVQESEGLEEEIFSGVEKKIESGEKEGQAKLINWRWLMAASVICFVLFGAYLYVFKIGANKSDTADTQKPAQDVEPGTYKAKLTLADGTVVVLDSAAQGELAKQGNVAVRNVDGRLIYDAHSNNSEVLYNILSTSIGESYATMLADGTKIWLNSGSSVKFPVSFTGSERLITASGEVFLEVAKDARRPFKVEVLQDGSKKCEVEVLGTSFNIMAYNDEARIETTLLEGKIALTRDNAKKLLIPGQQAAIDGNGNVSVKADVNLDVITAWKDQTFYFKNDDLKAVVRQISRWYGIEVVYEAAPPNETFTGMVSRNTNLSEVLKMLKAANIPFLVDGKKLVIMPQ